MLGVLALYNSEWQGGPSQLKDDLLREDASQPWGTGYGIVAVSLVLSRWVPQCQSELSSGWRWGEWVQVYNPCRVKTIRIAAYSIMYIPTLLLLHLV